MTDWKSKTKAKAASLKYQVTGTGGGPKVEIHLTDHEKRLLALMGNISYEGDNVREIGGLLTLCPSTGTHATPSTVKENKNSNLIQVHSQITSTPCTTPRLFQTKVLHREAPSLHIQSQSNELDIRNENYSVQYDTFFSENLAYTNKTKTSEVRLENIDDIDLEVLEEVPNIDLKENEVDISYMDHDYSSSHNINSENKGTNKKRKFNPRLSHSKSSERRAKVKGLSNEIKDMNNETLSVLKDIREEFLNVNRTLAIISSSISTLTKAVCTISEKFN